MSVSVQVLVLLLFSLFGMSLCYVYPNGSVSFSELTFINDTQPSVVSEKFPLLQIIMGGSYGISTLPYKTFRITNLANLGSTPYTSEFKQRPTEVFFYGWLDSIYRTETSGDLAFGATVLVYAAYYVRGFLIPSERYNLVAINWDAYNKGDYVTVVNRLQPIANEIGDQLYNMAFNTSDPIDLSNWHFVGFSLGAHLAGLIGRRIKEKSNGKFLISRITALDPAGPLLNWPIVSHFFPHIEKTDG
jgi:hypothetical protein